MHCNAKRAGICIPAPVLSALPPPVLFAEQLGPETRLFLAGELRVDVAHEVQAGAAVAVLDGELLAWRDGKPLPFSELQKRINRKTVGSWACDAGCGN